ncbi:unnamed protein product [Eruca vesicaria subsp. sativa]|uniref:Uncharacterized protein n=1 Tax=Eruca vesicaria subsp. sativa TaxID=29727 RepID=A0ABC8JQL0_ERUVS|nr:unnamed protein product [Eruca vesicaria subsp. sativa]
MQLKEKISKLHEIEKFQFKSHQPEDDGRDGLRRQIEDRLERRSRSNHLRKDKEQFNSKPDTTLIERPKRLKIETRHEPKKAQNNHAIQLNHYQGFKQEINLKDEKSNSLRLDRSRNQRNIN